MLRASRVASGAKLAFTPVGNLSRLGAFPFQCVDKQIHSKEASPQS